MIDVTRRRLIHHVTGLELGDETRFENGTLVVSAAEARECVADPALSEVRVAVASPGDATRIVKPLDVVEPRTLADGAGFPGHLDPPQAHANGDVHALAGAAVVAAGYLPRNQEGVIDLSGPGAEHTRFGTNHTIVVEFERAEDADWAAVDRALRHGLLQLASRLADAAVEAEPDDVVQLAAPSRERDSLPRIGVVTNLQTQGSFKDVFVYGRSLDGSLPTLLAPGEVDAGAIVSGQYGHPGLRNPTYMHQNHPVVAELSRRDGEDLRFAGLIVAPEPIQLAAKEHISAHAAAVAHAAGFDAAIVTKEGGGNADNDLSLKVEALARLGIEPVGIYAEMAGPAGTGQPIVAPPEEPAGMVSTGNYDERIQLPAMQRALGGDRVDLADQPAIEAMELPTAMILGSLSPLGAGNLTCGSTA